MVNEAATTSDADGGQRATVIPNLDAYAFARDSEVRLRAVLDGATEVETVLDVSGLPRVLALRHLRALVQRGIVVGASVRRPG